MTQWGVFLLILVCALMLGDDASLIKLAPFEPVLGLLVLVSLVLIGFGTVNWIVDGVLSWH